MAREEPFNIAFKTEKKKGVTHEEKRKNFPFCRENVNHKICRNEQEIGYRKERTKDKFKEIVSGK